MPTVLKCPSCEQPVRQDQIAPQASATCRSCGSPLRMELFPSYNKDIVIPEAIDEPAGEDDATCFFRPDLKARNSCDICGVFISDLYDLPVGDLNVCPECLKRETRKGKLEHLSRGFVLYDSLALCLAIVPLLLFPLFAIMTAPAALFLSLVYWNHPHSIVGRSKARFIAAIVISSLQIIGLIVLVIYFAMSFQTLPEIDP